VAISMLIPHIGNQHLQKMKQITHMACIEVAVRDTNPGSIRVNSSGKALVEKGLNAVDRERKQAGMDAIRAIFEATGAREVIPGDLGIGLHLMGGCGMGVNGSQAVVAPDFTIHDHPHFSIADSSIFPNAPGINPSLTIMALSKMAGHELQKASR
jgi:choline dehydrogenase-like flavoprotein